jgi:Trk-type K+ transport system membrane component
LFQAFAVRSGGFYVVPIASIAIGVQVLYVLMMYISVYPVTMTIRNSNVYEERSLGIYTDQAVVPQSPEAAETEEQKSGFIGTMRRRFTSTRLYAETGTYSRSYFVRQQIRSQLAHDLWWICLAVLFIMIIEGKQFAADPVSYSVFNVVFEVVSGYGTVGISVGLPNEAFSFCGGWHVLSKLILCAVMLRGRHRGLPVAIDRAVLLPGDHLAAAEEEDARLRTERTIERNSTGVDRPSSRPRTHNTEAEAFA